MHTRVTLKRRGRHLRQFAALLFCALLTTQSWAAITATADRTILDSDETLQLLVRVDEQVMFNEPDFESLKADFEILSNSRQQQYSNINGVTQSYTDWNLLLAPKRTGNLVIPSFNYKSDISDAIEITVRKASPKTAPGQAVYTETLIDKSAVAIQEQILLTHRLYTSVRLSDLALDELKLSDAVVEKVSETQFQKTVGGKNYLVLEIKYALFPQTVGLLTIPEIRFGAYESGNNQFGGFTTRGNRVLRSTEAKTVEVRAAPATISPDQWMPSSGVSLRQEWSGRTNKLTVGEPITRTITIEAKGLTAAQILPLRLDESSQYKIYPDQAQLDQELSADGVTGSRKESFALVPNEAGTIILPELTVRWWDTVNQRLQTATLPSQTLNVSPASAAPPAYGSAEALAAETLAQQGLATAGGTTTDDTSERHTLLGTLAATPILQLSLGINLVLLILCSALLLRQPRQALPRQAQSARTETRLLLKQQISAVEKAANKKDFQGVRDGILSWGRLLFTGEPVHSLQQIANLLDSPQLAEQFNMLDQHLYNSHSAYEPDLKRLLHLLKTAAVLVSTAKKAAHGALKPLYPNR